MHSRWEIKDQGIHFYFFQLKFCLVWRQWTRDELALRIDCVTSAMFQSVRATYFAFQIKQCCRPDERQTRGLGRKPRADDSGRLRQRLSAPLRQSARTTLDNMKSLNGKRICYRHEDDKSILRDNVCMWVCDCGSDRTNAWIDFDPALHPGFFGAKSR